MLQTSEDHITCAGRDKKKIDRNPSIILGEILLTDSRHMQGQTTITNWVEKKQPHQWRTGNKKQLTLKLASFTETIGNIVKTSN